MFYYLNGTVAEILPGLAVIDCGGVGYACTTTTATLSSLRKGEREKLYTYFHVAENAFGLYGVGPKAALAILSAGTPETLAMAVFTGDEKALTAAPGVGKKLAQRIILELKDKMAKETGGELDFSSGTPAKQVGFTSKASEAAQALAVLGYSSQEVSAALKGVDVDSLPLEEIIRQSLKKMVK